MLGKKLIRHLMKCREAYADMKEREEEREEVDGELIREELRQMIEDGRYGLRYVTGRCLAGRCRR